MTNCVNQRFPRTRLNYYRGTVIGREEPTSKDQKQRRYERLGCHKPVIPVVTFLTPLASNSEDVPPQPNSPPDNVFRRIISPGEPLEQKEGQCPPPTNGISTSSESAVRRGGRPQRGRSRSVPGPTRRPARRGEQLRAVHRQPGGLGLGPRAQPSEPIFFEVTDPFCRLPLPTLFHRPRGCSPWRPDAVMSTTRRGRLFGPPDFQGRRICTDGRSAQARARGFAAAAAPSYSSRPGCCPDGRSFRPYTQVRTSDLPRQYRCGPPPEFPLAAPLRHSSPSLRVPTASLAPYGFGRPLTSHTCQTPWSVFQGGSNGEPLARRQERAGATRNASGVSATLLGPQRRRIRGRDHPPGLGSPRDQRRSAPVGGGPALAVPASDRASPAPIRFPPDNFKHSLTLFSKSFFIFPSRLGRNLPPYLGCIPKQPDFADNASAVRRGRTGGAVTLSGAHSMGLCARSVEGRLLQNYNSSGEKPLDSHLGLFRLARPLLGESFGCSHLTWGHNPSKASGSRRQLPGQGSLQSRGLGHDTEPTQGPGRAEPPLSSCRSALGAKCFSANLAGGARAIICCAPATRPAPPPAVGQQGTGGGEHVGRDALADFDGSRDSAIHTKYRIFASFFIDREPRYPLPRVVLGYRVRGRTPKTRRTYLRFLFAWHSRGRVVCSMCSSSGPSRGWTLSPSAPGRARRGDSTGVCTAAPAALGASCAASFAWVALRLGGIDNDPSAGSPTETLLRLLLPLNDKVEWTFIALSAANRQRRPAIEHFTGPFNRQIAPPTKSGHAPPPIESRKSSRSVNPYYADLACFEHSNFFKVTARRHATRPVKARAHRPRLLARTCPQWILVKGFRLYSFQLPDSESPVLLFIVTTSRVGGWVIWRLLPSLDVVAVSRAPSPNRTLILRHPSIPWINQVASSRGRDASTAAPMRVRPAPGQGHRRSSKVGRSDFVLNQPSPSGLPHSHGSMNTFVVRRSEHTRA
ncbi:hypothetical protein H6P81_021225 [Aristolochia fimbriata]|uniref:Uncharacterized protein n=1 Tax=Aristolochia fimbriata TaxID=158543 RepID=A0AAV7DRY8_ARIFI|nr:hypothetical protein H6P81_021225 [Aristolochia fimbriata]